MYLEERAVRSLLKEAAGAGRPLLATIRLQQRGPKGFAALGFHSVHAGHCHAHSIWLPPGIAAAPALIAWPILTRC